MPDLGTKYECASCATKFYDLGRGDAICPKCGLNPLTEEVEEIAEEEPAAEEEAAPDEAGDEAEDKDGDKNGDEEE